MEGSVSIFIFRELRAVCLTIAYADLLFLNPANNCRLQSPLTNFVGCDAGYCELKRACKRSFVEKYGLSGLPNTANARPLCYICGSRQNYVHTTLLNQSFYSILLHRGQKKKTRWVPSPSSLHPEVGLAQ